MYNPSSNEDPKSFVDNVFAREEKRKEEKVKKQANLPIDLAAGGIFNMDRLTEYYVSANNEPSYKRRVQQSLHGTHNMSYEEAALVNNVFLNMERILFDLVGRYYDDNQLKLFSSEMSLVSDEIKDATRMYQISVFEMIDNKDMKWEVFDQMVFLPGWRQNAATLKLKSEDGRVALEKSILTYMISDLTQVYLNCLTDALRTDLKLFSQFVYQLSLLSENVSEVLTVLYNEINTT